MQNVPLVVQVVAVLHQGLHCSRRTEREKGLKQRKIWNARMRLTLADDLKINERVPTTAIISSFDSLASDDSFSTPGRSKLSWPKSRQSYKKCSDKDQIKGGSYLE
jgi:hypothetical protein